MRTQASPRRRCCSSLRRVKLLLGLEQPAPPQATLHGFRSCDRSSLLSFLSLQPVVREPARGGGLRTAPSPHPAAPILRIRIPRCRPARPARLLPHPSISSRSRTIRVVFHSTRSRVLETTTCGVRSANHAATRSSWRRTAERQRSFGVGRDRQPVLLVVRVHDAPQNAGIDVPEELEEIAPRLFILGHCPIQFPVRPR